jgi:small subunit ribosomal protein S4
VEQAIAVRGTKPSSGVWLEANFENMSGRVLHLPKRADVNLPINEQLIVELYSQVTATSCLASASF